MPPMVMTSPEGGVVQHLEQEKKKFYMEYYIYIYTHTYTHTNLYKDKLHFL